MTKIYRSRNIDKHIWLSEEEANVLKEKANKCGLRETEFIRKLILEAAIKEKPDDEFYSFLNELSSIGNNINQISAKANSLNFIDTVNLQKEIKELKEFRLSMMKKYLG